MPETMDTLSIHSETTAKEDSDEIPDGPTFPLNSKQLNVMQIKRIAGALDMPTGAAADEVRQMLGEKLRSMGHDPANVQVIIQVEGDNSNFYVVDDTGIIKCVMGNVDDHVEGHVTEEVIDIRLCSALHEAGNESLVNELAMARQELLEIKSIVSQLASLTETNNELQRLLDKERHKSKWFWKQKCDLMLAHEEALEERDARITALHSRLRNRGETEATRTGAAEPPTHQTRETEAVSPAPRTKPLSDTEVVSSPLSQAMAGATPLGN